MAKIHPFKAIRPTRDKVHLVASRPYYTYKSIVLKAKLQDNPYTFMHIITPDFDKEDKTKPNSNERFERIADRYREFLDKGILIQDQVPSLYIYRQSKADRVFSGVICGASVNEYKEDHIKKHEATLTAREAMFTNYLDIVGYNAEPVLLAHPDSVEIDELIEKVTVIRPEYEFSTTDLIKHELWCLNPQESASIIKAFEKIDNLYIADGHHRTASSVGLYDHREQKKHKHYPNEAYFLSYIIGESKLQIFEFNRLIRGLNGHSIVEFVNLLSKNFVVKKLEKQSKPKDEHKITMYLDKSWYELTCLSEIIDQSHPVKCLDAEILTDYILTPLLGIENLKTNENISFISGIEPLKKIEKSVDKGEYSVAFILYPVTMNQVKKVADNQMIMPPKSTWVEPKLRSGLTIYNINE